MDSASIIELAGGSASSDYAVKQAKFLGASAGPNRRDEVGEVVDLLESLRSDRKGSKANDEAKSDETSTITIGGDGGKPKKFKFVQVLRCPDSRIVDSNLLAMAINTDKVVPNPTDWANIEIDHRTGQLCVPPTYAAEIKRFYKDTAAGAAARLQQNARDLSSMKIKGNLMESLSASLGSMSTGAFDGLAFGSD